ncbi:MotA/TolQ/ExbB proton channel family protein [Stenotrophobium rhamnosiphilum]|uniref:Flagellar motor protein MotA n=1 Tax=Stenotrophobium rhamnosiphilum TaxID=2029166 RepID=A0A2T5MEK4_9GAMM|nr:MotA/TolQ/ExbB proton channel family protein [Stenotrophobium rhamnosiphilum]PTU31004.1 flagellar motor protein MotA [Stenotrophobium rhamnosiphilum]
MEFIEHILGFFQQGGAFMYPIALVLVIGLAITVERLLLLRRAERENSALWKQIQPLIEQKDFNSAEQLAKGSDSAVGRVLGAALEHARTHGDSRAELELAVEESLMEVTPIIEKRTHYLATLSNMSTLLGLLGTVIGLITAFAALAKADALEKADLLSAGISEAMNCTAFGLMVAIPFLLIHAFLQTRTNDLVDSLEMACMKLVNARSAANRGNR